MMIVLIKLQPKKKNVQRLYFMSYVSLCSNLTTICYQLALMITLKTTIVIIRGIQKQIFFLPRFNYKNGHKLPAYQGSIL